MVCFSGNKYFRYVFDQLFKRQKKKNLFSKFEHFCQEPSNDKWRWWNAWRSEKFGLLNASSVLEISQFPFIKTITGFPQKNYQQSWEVRR